jgi:hypothetical protein
MPDLHTAPSSTDSTAWQATDVFRETFLLRVSPAGKDALLQQISPLLHQLAGATDRLALPDEPPARAGLRAATADLHHLQAFLATVAREAKAEPHPEEDPRHLLILAKLASTLGRATAILEKALAWSIDPDDPER